MLEGRSSVVEDPKADIPLQHAAQVDHGLVAQAEPLPFLVGDDFGLLGGVEPGV